MTKKRNNLKNFVISTCPVDLYKKMINAHKIEDKKIEFLNIDSPKTSILSKNLPNKIDNIFLICEINKCFSSYEKTLANNNKDLKTLDKEINHLIEILEYLSNKTNKIYFFNFPSDVNDNYFGSLNFKKEGKNWLINYINLQIGNKLSQFPDIFILDLNFLIIKNNFNKNIYDEKLKYLINSSYSLNFIKFLSDQIINLLSEKFDKKIKLFILDLDNTIWGGEAGEREYDFLELGPSSIKGIVYENFQKRLKNLKNKGFILSICSKNNISNVKKVFSKNRYMHLNLNDFSCVKVNWKNKNENVTEILEELNLREENAVFIDDNKFEREIIRKNFKDIKIFDFPENIMELNFRINNLVGTFKNNISDTDYNRTNLYLDESKRKNLKKKIFDPIKWIKELKIELKISTLKNFDRASEMFKRTNQFNISHKEKSKSELVNFSKKKDYLCYEISMKDKFGDYGFISLLIVKIKNKNYFINDFLLSCRVFERNIEPSILQFLNKNSKLKNKLGFININRNKKNIYFQNFFDNSNFLERTGINTYKILNKINPNNEIKVLK